MMARRGCWMLMAALVACGDSEAAMSSSGGTEGTGVAEGGGDPGLPGMGWTLRRQVTLDPSVLDLGLTDVPVLVRLDGSRIEYTQTNAFTPDVRFYDGELGKELAFDVEQWNPEGTSYLWVKLPVIEDTDAGRAFYMYYGNDGLAEAGPGSEVWSNAFSGVWHMADGAIGGVSDASGHGHDAMLDGGGASLRTAQLLGPALSIDASASALRVPDTPTLFLGQSMTLEGWVNADRVDDDALRSIVRKRDSYALRTIGDMTGNPGAPQGVAWFTTADERGVTADAPLARGQWTHLAMTYDGPSGEFALWVDGVLVQTRAPPSEDVTDSDFDLEMGLEAYGLVDEVRISTVARDAAWMSVQHLSMTDALLTFGSPDVTTDGG
jgi:hypothetical protein